MDEIQNTCPNKNHLLLFFGASSETQCMVLNDFHQHSNSSKLLCNGYLKGFSLFF